MDNVCYTVIVRQQMCQSGTPVTRENAYSNVSQGTLLELLNGYTLRLESSMSNTSNLRFTNTLFGIDIQFNIANDTVTIFDLPVENTIFRVSVYVQARCCKDCT